jgi:hypothetical protein
MHSTTLREYLKREATDVLNVLLVALVVLTIWAALWVSPTIINHIGHWNQTNSACVEGGPLSKTLGDVIRSRNRCV